MGDGTGETIEDRFTLGPIVGRGASSDVHRGRERATGRVVAIKRLRATAANARAVGRLAREARLLARLDNSHVVRFLAHGVDRAGRPCLVLEWIEGEDLARRQRTAPLEAADAVEVARQAALGLHGLHQLGIVHRDVKPANLILVAEPDGRAHIKLVDLGIARSRDEAALTTHGIVMGSPAYMSPEQARGEDGLTPRSDLFSLGVVLFELLSGTRPFTGSDAFTVMAKILFEPIPKLSDRLPVVAPALEALCARAMARDPAARYASGAEMAAALEAARPRAPVSVRPAPITPASIAPAGASAPPGPASDLATLEQRVVTAVFAAFAGATEGLHVFEQLAAEHGGTTERTLGQWMIAAFGAQRSQGDEALRAARVALAAQAVIPGVRLAIATGRAVTRAGEIAGEALDRGAAALERARGAVEVDEPTARLIEQHFLVEGADGARVLRAERALEHPTGPTLLGRRTPTLGRDRELAVLHEVFAGCADESAARCVLVTAPAGVGKSRLKYEFLQRLRARSAPAHVLIGRGDSLGTASPFAPLADALRREAGVAEGDALGVRREKLRARVARHVPAPDVARVAAFLGELAGIHFADDASDALRAARGDATLMSDAMVEAWLAFLAAETSAHPVLFVLEDLHWCDAPSVRFVDVALRDLADRPLMVLALARPDVHARFTGLWSGRGLHEIRLAPLPRKASERLVHEALGADVSRDVLAAITERADGNAFFLEELIRTVAVGGEQALPDTVLGIVQARLDGLAPETRRVVRAASVFGRRFWRGALEALLGESVAPGRLAESLDELVAQEVVVRRSAAAYAGEKEYYFSHALSRDAAYASLTAADCAACHRRAAQWLGRAGEEDAAVLATHYDRGGARDEAVAWYTRAAEQALESNDFASADARAERGIACGAADVVRGRLRMIQADACARRGETAESALRAEEAAGLVPSGSREWFRAVARLVASCGLEGKHDVVAAWVARADAATAAPDALAAQVALLCRSADHLLDAGRPEAADALLAHAEQRIAAAGGDGYADARLRLSRAVRALFAGDAEDYVTALETAVAEFERAGDLRQLVRARGDLGFGYAQIGEFERAEPVLAAALQGAQRAGLALVAAWIQYNIGNVWGRRGQLDDARRGLTEAVAAAKARRMWRLGAAALGSLSAVELDAKDPVAAERAAREALALVATQPGARPPALAALAEALLARGEVAEALTVAREAVEMIETLGRVAEGEARARWAFAEALRRSGDVPAAYAATARAMSRLMERASRIRDPARRECFLSRIVEHSRTVSLWQRLLR